MRTVRGTSRSLLVAELVTLHLDAVRYELKKNSRSTSIGKDTEFLLDDPQINYNRFVYCLLRKTKYKPSSTASNVEDHFLKDVNAVSGHSRPRTMTKESDIPTIFNPRRSRAPSVLVTEEGVANGPFSHTDSVSSSQPDATGEQQQQTATSGGVSGKLKSCSGSLCSKSAKKIYFGIWVTVCVTASWVGATHCIKYLYLRRPLDHDDPVLLPEDTTGLNMTALHKHYVSNLFKYK
ncbi:hypothetical protein Trydic_g6633 [Trypoxylus dichotomus]